MLLFHDRAMVLPIPEAMLLSTVKCILIYLIEWLVMAGVVLLHHKRAQFQMA